MTLSNKNYDGSTISFLVIVNRSVFQIIIQSKTPILWPHMPDEGRTNVKSHSVWCDGGQLHGKGDHVENGRMISPIGARRTCTH